MPSVPPAITNISPSPTDSRGRRKRLWLNLSTAFILVIAIVCAFQKTVFSGQQISRVYQLGQRDTLFLKYFSPRREGYDSSVYQYFVPSHAFTSKQLKSGVVPLWNPLVGCGAPYLADVETAVFWPARLLLMSLPDLRSWNLLLVTNIISFALGMFFLGKALGLRRFAILYGSLILAFCPFLIFQSELIGSSSSMIPLVMASFVYARADKKLIRRILAGIACALMILSGHPEPSFFGIVCASMLYLFLAFFEDKAEGTENADGLVARSKAMLKALLDIAIIGVVAFAFSAFMLLPFLELLKNSDCYKLGLQGHRFGVPLNSILINLIHPAYNNSSPFLGILCVPLALFALITGFRTDRTVKAISLCAFIAIALMSQIGPLDALMNSSAFSWFVPKYCWPSLLIFISILAAKGFENLIDQSRNEWRKTSIAVIIVSLLTLLCLGLIRVNPEILQCIRQDEAFEKMQVFGKFWTRDLICLTVFAVLVAGSKFLGKMQAMLCVLVVSVCTVLSIAPVAKLASPLTDGFNYDLVEPIPFLQHHSGRVLTMGRHVFCPSSNFVYGINNLVPVNVYHPRRFQDFLVACGVTPEGVNQFFDGRVSSLIDHAAVKYLVSPQPVLSKAESVTPPQPLHESRAIGWGKQAELQLTGGAIDLYRQNREMLGSLKFSVPPEQASELALQGMLTDEKGNVLWLGDTERLMYLFDKRPTGVSRIEITKDILVAIPAVLGKLSFSIQIFNYKDMSYLPLTESSSTDKNKLLLAEFDAVRSELRSQLLASSVADDSARRFKLCSETNSHIRVYENTRALPQAYLTRTYDLLPDDKAVLKDLLSSKAGAARVLFELANEPKGIPKPNNEVVQKNEPIRSDEKADCKRIDCNSIEVETSTGAPAYLVLAENYYPGWHAEIEHDGVRTPTEIARANYLFQAVLVPQGRSIVRFRFSPSGYNTGLVLFGVALLSVIGISLLPLLKKAKD